MKIYNEVITRFNETTGKWETLYEDSYQHNGEVALLQEGDDGTGAGGGGLSLPANATEILTDDTIIDTIKTTAGYFTNGDGTLNGSNIYTMSLADANENYYFNVAQTHPLSSSAETQFSVTYGHVGGSGSNQYGDSTTNNKNIIGQTQAVYKQLTSLLLTEAEQSGGFKIASRGSYLGSAGSGNSTLIATTAGARDDYIYALVGKRARFKDRINKKSWTLILSGSGKAGSATAGCDALKLTDDSAYVAAENSPAGPRYNIVSGTLGTPTGSGNPANAYKHRTYGWFYPEMGIMLFSGIQLSASIPGPPLGTETTASFHYDIIGAGAPAGNMRSSSGFAPNHNATANSKNALKFVNCMRNTGDTFTTLRLRSEEDQTQYNYFCRIKAGQYNFSNNPTFTSGSTNKIRQSTMIGNPTTYITGVGLYNSAGQLLATAKLSSPLKKNFASEATVKVKLTY